VEWEVVRVSAVSGGRSEGLGRWAEGRMAPRRVVAAARVEERRSVVRAWSFIFECRVVISGDVSGRFGGAGTSRGQLAWPGKVHSHNSTPTIDEISSYTREEVQLYQQFHLNQSVQNNHETPQIHPVSLCLSL